MLTGDIYRESERRLRPFTNNRELSSLEAYLIVSYVLDKGKSYILAYPEKPVSDEKVAEIRKFTDERLTGKPIAYVLGSREFWSMPFKVTPATLIPRPDSETLVEQALLRAGRMIDAGMQEKDLRILDMGTGTGCIALALKHELKDANIDAIDYQDAALKVAEENAASLGLKVNFWNSDWFRNIKSEHQYNIIVSNPPYVAQDDPHLTQGDVRFEPTTALIAPMNGIKDLLDIIKNASEYLTADGVLLVEHGYQQGGEVKGLMRNACFTGITTVRDLGYNERVTWGIRGK